MFGNKERELNATERQAYNSEFGYRLRAISRVARIVMVIATALFMLYVAFRMGQRFPDL